MLRRHAAVRISPQPARDPDVELMLRVQQDDAAAFEQLLARHRAGVRQQLWLMVGHRDEADDLTQDVFLKVYRHRKSYQPRARFVTWLYHIVRNVGRNALRTRRRRPVLPLWLEPGGEAHNGTAPLTDRRAEPPAEPIERAELREQVHGALAALRVRHRQALVLRQFEGWSHVEIAARFRLTAKAAKSLLYRARNEMRNALRPYMLAE